MATQTTRQAGLYALLPAIYRERDVELGEPLRALLRTIQEQATLVESDIRRLWDNFFIETCEPSVISYISYEAENVQARRLGAVGDFRYHGSPLGYPAPLFTSWRREGDEVGLAT